LYRSSSRVRPRRKWHKTPEKAAWFKIARFRVTLGISARTLIGPTLE